MALRCNCLIWAIAAWRRFGGYILVRRSHWGPFPHFLWVDKRRRHVISYKPLNPELSRWRPIWFYGAVRWGDECEKRTP